MDQDKPFKTIEVVDSRTNQICKIACMSCIRGHRTTACGIPVCRQKIFWTVKRPGRPSNSCTCRYGATGGCKCVVAKSACPHKAKKGVKGERRSGECRCDEQGRYCCLLDAQHWDMLLTLQKPAVEFFNTREALEAKYRLSDVSAQTTPSFSGNSPGIFGVSSARGTPAPPGTSQTMPPATHGVQSPPRTILPRFGKMGIGSPQDSHVVPADALSWAGQAPEAPRDYPSAHYPPSQPAEARSCCQGPDIPSPAPQYAQYAAPDPLPALPQQATFAPFQFSMMPSETIPEPDLPQPTQAGLNFAKFNTDYFNYQFPSAICQTCGLSGCTCRNCPPVMQNANNGSWAQCCGRKHARTAAYIAPAETHAYQQQPLLSDPPGQFGQQSLMDSAPPLSFHQETLFEQPTPHFAEEPQQRVTDLTSPGQSIPDFIPFDPGDVEGDFMLHQDVRPSNMDISDLLLSDLDRPSSGCCCGDP